MIDFRGINIFIVIAEIMCSNVNIWISKWYIQQSNSYLWKKNIFKISRKKAFHVWMWIDRNQRDCVIIFKKFNEVIFFSALTFVQFNEIRQSAFWFVSQFKFKFDASANENVNTIIIKNEIVKKLFTNEKYDSEIIIMNYNCMNVVILFVVITQNTNKKNEKMIKTMKKRILNKKIEKKKLSLFKILRSEKWKKIAKKYENLDEKKIWMSNASIVETSNVEKKESQIKIMIFDKIFLSATTLNVTIVDFFLSSKICKLKISPKFKLINFWKSIENSDNLIQKIQNTQITLNFEKLMIYVFVVHKLFTKKSFKKQMFKFQIRNLIINMNDENVDFWYFSANFWIWTCLKNRVRILTLMNFEIEINFMNADVQKNLRFTMHAMLVNFRINFQIDQILNLIDVCPHVKIKIEKLNIYHYFLLWIVLIIFLFSNNFFQLLCQSIMIIARTKFTQFASIQKWRVLLWSKLWIVSIVWTKIASKCTIFSFF